MWHFVYQKAERVPFQVEQNADRAAIANATFDAPFVQRIVLEPGPLLIDVHCEAFVVFAWCAVVGVGSRSINGVCVRLVGGVKMVVVVRRRNKQE